MTNIKQNWVACEVEASGTISGRSKEGLFLTMPARATHEDTKIGFGTQATHQFSKDSDYTFVGFDFSAEELNVAGMFSEAYNQSASGKDLLNKALLEGTKENRTDLHTKVADDVGVPRDVAKAINFAMTYGCGVKTATNSVLQGLPDDQKPYATKYAKKGLKSFKGNKEGRTYRGGIASNYFNYVYTKSGQSKATLDYFGQPIPKCLDVDYIHKSGSPSAINYFIQAACSSNGMLSGFLTFFHQEIRTLGIESKVRYSMSIHDAVYFICHKDFTRECAVAIIRAHASSWALLSHNLGIPDLPVSRLIFEVEIDCSRALLKSHNQVINTPDFNHAETPETGYRYYVSRETGKLVKDTKIKL